MGKYEKIMDLLKEKGTEEIMWLHDTYCEKDYCEGSI